jgi:hypothetical protein
MSNSVDPELNVDLANALGTRRGTGAPVRRGFAQRPAPGRRSALGGLLSGAAAPHGGGGRGGRLRVALLLTLIWRLAAPPHSTTRPARYWADLLQLEDPDGAGARTIRNTIQELERRGFLRTVDRGPGHAPEVFLLSEEGGAGEYQLPYIQAMDGESTSYFRVPEELWRSGVAAKLSGAALAMYLIALSAGSDGRDFWFSPALFRERYGLGESTRKTGLAELVDHNILFVQTTSVDGTGGTGYRRFRRNVYTVGGPWRPDGPRFDLASAAPTRVDRENRETVLDSPAPENRRATSAP